MMPQDPVKLPPSPSPSFRRRRVGESPAQYFQAARAKLDEARSKHIRERRQQRLARLPSPYSIGSDESDYEEYIEKGSAIDRFLPVKALAIRFPPFPDETEPNPPMPSTYNYEQREDTLGGIASRDYIATIPRRKQREAHRRTQSGRVSRLKGGNVRRNSHPTWTQRQTRVARVTRATRNYQQEILLELDERGRPQPQAPPSHH
ncbi:hypothetical protein F4677DRAFT_429342 [Hypoxylon crocopeplum]|nr:hypothetical protein F4677DRAFT_429342 [Hypoxylon crocopeplum]